MEQSVQVSFLPTSIPAQSGHPSLMTFNNLATMLYRPQPQIYLAIPFPPPRLGALLKKTLNQSWRNHSPAGPQVRGDTLIYFLVGLCSLFLSAGISNLHSLPQALLLSTPDSAFCGTEGVKEGRVSSPKLPALLFKFAQFHASLLAPRWYHVSKDLPVLLWLVNSFPCPGPQHTQPLGSPFFPYVAPFKCTI